MTALLAILIPFSLAAATIDVQVANSGGAPLTDAVVYALPARPIPIGHVVAYMDQKDRVFVPHVLPIQTGTWVEFPNSDNIRHQVFSVSPAKRFQLPLYIGKPAFPLQFSNPGVVAIGCNIHEQMNAFIVVVDTPYFGKTENGRVTLQNVEPGQYTVHVWHADMKQEPKTQTVTVTASDHPALSFVTAQK